jgi:hypothetical protein
LHFPYYLLPLPSLLSSSLPSPFRAVFKEQQQYLKLGGFKGTVLPYDGYTKIPEFVLYTRSGKTKVVGEAKVPWVPKHSIKSALKEHRLGHDKHFRHLLGQSSNLLC